MILDMKDACLLWIFIFTRDSAKKFFNFFEGFPMFYIEGVVRESKSGGRLAELDRHFATVLLVA